MKESKLLGMLNLGISLIFFGNYRVGAVSAFLWKVVRKVRKMHAKWLPKCSKIKLGSALGQKMHTGNWKIEIGGTKMGLG